MNENIGAASQADDLLGSLAGQDDQAIGEFPELGLVALARFDRAANENASRPSAAGVACSRASPFTSPNKLILPLKRPPLSWASAA